MDGPSTLEGQNIVVLTGAGISSESGLKTFRDDNGLWEGHRVEEVATPEAFERDPETVHRFYNLRRKQLNEVEPNRAHRALAEFEASHKGAFLVVTQNVDDLHERAGSENVLHMHGEIKKVRCQDSGEVFPWDGDLTTSTPHPKTGKNGRLRPHICWFGEMPFHMDAIEKALQKCDVFVAIGTSGVVYPAAGLAGATPPHCRRVLLNKENSGNSSLFDEVHLGSATELVERFFVGN